MKKLLAILIILIPTFAWAGIKTFTPGDSYLDHSNTTTNNHTSTSFALKVNDAYVMHYDLTSIAGQTVTFAKINIWSNRCENKGFTYYRVLPAVDNTTSTWTIYKTASNWNTSGALGAATDYTTTNSVAASLASGSYVQTDISAMVQDALNAGNKLDIAFRATDGLANPDCGGSGQTLDTGTNATNPAFLTVATGTPGVPNLYYADDGGGTYGNDSSHCNGTGSGVFTGSNGPTCAVSNPKYIMGDGSNSTIWQGGDILYINGDSSTSYIFTVSGVTTKPSVTNTYTNNTFTYTITAVNITGSSGTITATSSVNGGAPSASGTLTRTSGSGDATISFSAFAHSQAQYAIGATLNPVPGGIAGQQTKVIGTGTNYAQIYPTAFLAIMFDVINGYSDLEHLDFTPHDNCIRNGPLGPGGATTNPDGFNYVCGADTTSITGIRIGGTGNTFTSLLVHGFQNGWNNDINGGVVGDNTFTNVKTFGNGQEGLSIGQGQNTDNVMTGTMTFINSQFDFNGCGQRWPLQDTADLYSDIGATGLSHSVDNTSNYYNCWGQDQGGYGDGVAFGPNGSANAGNWKVLNSSISFNTQDGLDTLHGNGNGTITVIRSKFEGNAGQQIKLNGKIEDVENNLIMGDCPWWIGASVSSTTYGSTQGTCAQGFYCSSVCHGPGSGVCRAFGDVTLFVMGPGTQVYFFGNTITANGIAIEGGGGGCNSSSGLHIKNNIIYGGGYAAYNPTICYLNNPQPVTYIYLSGSDGNGSGTCGPVGNGSGGVIVPDEDYNIVYGTKNNNQGCNGAHDICGQLPGFQSAIPMGTPSGATNTYYQGTTMSTLVPLVQTSVARGVANTTGLVYTNGTNDYNSFPLNSPPDMGGLQYGSTPSFCSGNGVACTTNGGCCSGFCVSGSCAAYNCGDGVITSPEVCDGSNLNSQTCVTQGFASGTLSCAGNCLSFVTSSCSGTKGANGTACTTGSDCISGLCSGLVCVANICGNGIIEGSEVCDGALLNNNTCTTVGAFTGGTLACSGNCLTFNTSGCVSSNGVSMGFSGVGGN